MDAYSPSHPTDQDMEVATEDEGTPVRDEKPHPPQQEITPAQLYSEMSDSPKQKSNRSRSGSHERKSSRDVDRKKSSSRTRERKSSRRRSRSPARSRSRERRRRRSRSRDRHHRRHKHSRRRDSHSRERRRRKSRSNSSTDERNKNNSKNYDLDKSYDRKSSPVHPNKQNQSFQSTNNNNDNQRTPPVKMSKQNPVKPILTQQSNNFGQHQFNQTWNQKPGLGVPNFFAQAPPPPPPVNTTPAGLILPCEIPPFDPSRPPPPIPPSLLNSLNAQQTKQPPPPPFSNPFNLNGLGSSDQQPMEKEKKTAMPNILETLISQAGLSLPTFSNPLMQSSTMLMKNNNANEMHPMGDSDLRQRRTSQTSDIDYDVDDDDGPPEEMYNDDDDLSPFKKINKLLNNATSNLIPNKNAINNENATTDSSDALFKKYSNVLPLPNTQPASKENQPKTDWKAIAQLHNRTDFATNREWQDRIALEVKSYLKPAFFARKITKEDYMEIMKKSVTKISRSGIKRIDSQKIGDFVKLYIKKYRRMHKKEEYLTSVQKAGQDPYIRT